MTIDIVCRTPGCGNENVHILLTVPDDCGGAMCGACGTMVTTDARTIEVKADR